MTSKPAALTLMAVAAIAGGGAGAVVVATSRDGDNRAATVTQTTSNAAAGTAVPASDTTTSTTLTASEIYRNDNKGVVDLVVNADAEGSGFVIDRRGDIVTNEHVVDGARTIRVTFSDGTKASATVVGSDKTTDIAVVRVTGIKASMLTPLTFGDSSAVEAGDAVLAIGSPFGLAETLTTGIVSGTDRTIESPSGATIGGAIQTDASINHGNSGGPLIDAEGDVVGVNAQIESDSGGSDGVGFAIPSNTARSVALQLIAGETVEHPQLGVQIEDGSSGGVKLAAVTAGGAAAAAGLKAGDTITAIDGTTVGDADALASLIASHQPGDRVRVTYRRGSASATVTATLGESKS
ncbi:S1C family serine protease [Conexibacter woesei]|uniref:S1C family serine protease n=1 Tax=Conexibacter woesei TaxID=191495 RepID=UPI000406DFD7|nr:trypsin-like peptidase domain-containing protein [Conexibacter woesei]